MDTKSSDVHCGTCGNACSGELRCSAGQCEDVGCDDECSRKGARVCDDTGQNGYQVCAADWDGDDCLEWGPLNRCEGYQTCEVGICLGEPPACDDDCGIGKQRCADSPDNGVETCGDFDDDPCLEWGGYTDCQHGTCTDGACPNSCADECQPSDRPVCDGGGYLTCGDHDDDECLEWSAVQDCGPDRDCESGECCIEDGEDCEEYEDCCDCFHCCPVFKECVPDWWDFDCL